MSQKKTLSYEFTKGFIRENPLLVLTLGTCPSLAVTTTVQNGIGMGLAATFVLILSNFVISLLRKVIPDKVRIPAYITIIASLVTVLQFLLEAYVPALNKSLGIFIPLITVNCIILGRAEAFASQNGILASVMDGAGMGLGFTGALFLIGALREILGAGSFWGVKITFLQNIGFEPMALFSMPAGGFAIFGVVVIIAQVLKQKMYRQKPAETLVRKNYPGSINSATQKLYQQMEKDMPREAEDPGKDAVPEMIRAKDGENK